jgi:hypothetical protein
MIVVVWPASIALLVPVILIEAAVAVRILKLGPWDSLKLSGAANAASTLLGVPLTWFLLALIEIGIFGGGWPPPGTPRWALRLATVGSPWLPPRDEFPAWMVPAAGAVLCIPFFVVSTVSEALVARQFVAKSERGRAWRWAWSANALSYGLIGLWLAYLVFDMHRKGAT